jgi:EmrB/QacA subfamily drug resistance transporter
MNGARSPRTFSPLDPQAAAAVRPGHVLLVNFLAAWLAAFTTTSINIALPSIQTEFRLGAVPLGWLPLGYVLASAVFQLPFAKIGDRIGRRLLFLGGIAIFGVSSVAMVFVGSYAPLLIFRLVQGVGGAMIFSSSMALVTLAYPPQRRGWAMGISVAAAYLGQTTGPLLGGVIVHNVGWRNLFLVTGCFAFFNLGLDLSLLRRAEWKEGERADFDRTGSAVYALALSAFLLGLSWLPQIQGVVLFVAGLAGLAFFVWWETRARSPIMVIGLFRNRVFAFSNITALISYASVWAVTYLMSLYLQFIKGLNAQTAGLVLIVGVALQVLLSPFGGRLSDRIEPRWVASGGMALCVIGLLLFSFLDADTPYWYIIVALAFLGLGYSFFSGPNQSSIMGSVERRHVGFASASISTVRMVGQAFSIAFATLIMATIVGRQDIRPADYPNLLTATRTTFAILTGLCALGVAASLVRGRMPAHPPEAALPTRWSSNPGTGE